MIQSDGNPEQDTTDLREDENLGALADSEYTFSVLSEPRHPEADANQTIQASDHVPSENPGVAEEPTSPEMTSPEPSDSETKTILPQKHKPRKKLRSDPIHWYGILVPPSLRRAQASFAQAIDHPIPDLASTTVQMRTLEQEISQVRVQLEIEASATT